MGILEVHDGSSRVERIKLTRDTPLLFGSNPMCDVVLTGPGVAPFHGRIRWADRRFKVDAGAEIGSIEVNGKPLKSSTLYQGDEIKVGPCRIFVISVEDPSNAKAEPSVSDHTQVLDTPAAVNAAAQVPPKTRPVSKPVPLKKQPAGEDELGLEFGLDEEEEEVAPRGKAKPAKTPDFAPNEPLQRGRNARKQPKVESKGEPATVALKVGPPPTIFDKIKKYLPAGDGPPGQEKVLSSPLVIGLAGALIVLLILSVSLLRIIGKNNADKAYNKAVESVNDGDYVNAINRFDEFLKGHRSDPRAPKARVLQGMAKVRQFTGSAGASWTQALQSSQEFFKECGEIPEFQDVANELGEQLIKVAEAEADKAKANSETEPLDQVDAALALHAEVLGESSPKFIEKSSVPKKIADAKAAILKTRTREEAIAAMTKGLDEKKPKSVYQTRDALINKYPDLLSDREVVARLTKANELIKLAAIADPANRPGSSEPHPDPLGPPVSFVLRTNPGTVSSNGPLVYALADGFVVAVDGNTGTPVWMTAVGLASPFAPIPLVGGEPAVIAFDSRFDEIVKLNARTGKLIWRQEIRERIDDPPLVVGNKLYQSTPSGKLLMLDLRSGNLLGSLDLGRPLTRTPVVDESGEHLYVLGEEDCLFVLQRNPLSCLGVEYLGHETGSIACAPARVGRFLVIPENKGMNEGRWRIVLVDEEGLNPKVVQTLPVAGWTWSTPKDIGSLLWSVSDRNEIASYTIGLYDSPTPLKLLARLNPDNEPSGPAFAFGKTERELLVASGRTSKLNLVTETAKLEPVWTIGNIGPALAPIQESDKLVVFTHQAMKMPGIALRGVDPAKGDVKWQTILGAPFPVALEPSPDKSGFRTLGLAGEPVNLPAALLKTGGFVDGKIPPPGDFTLPPTGDIWLPVEGPTVVVPGKNAANFLVQRADGFKPLDLPAPLHADPLVWGKDIFLPSEDGRAYVINPHTGENTADPFVPPFDKAHPSLWKNPVKLDDDAVALIDEEGRLRRVIRAANPRPHLEITADQKLPAPAASEIASTGGAVIVATTDGDVRAFAARDLAPVGKWTLEAPRAAGPISAGGHAFVADATGNVLAFGPDGQRLWQVKLQDAMAPAAPAVKDGVVWFLTRAGGLEGRALTDGAARGRVALGVLPTGGVLDIGADRVVPAGRGTIRALQTEVAASAPGNQPKGGAKP